ncbi:MAG: zinc-dependent peptidase [Candidatus Hydrogenedentes bacterium]|nr:zinc-dependent peptidase [Candidatus Hydrogenedentota bacterium]
MIGFFKRRRRARVLAQPFPEDWAAVLRAEMPYYRKLPDTERVALHGHVRVLLAEKRFEGCGGIRLEDRHRLIIAGYAALLLLGRPGDYFPQLYSILIYPYTFLARVEEPDEDGMVWEEEEEREGESWSLGAIVLSWPDVERDIRVLNGRNVILHEFAHHLHEVDGVFDGAHFMETAEEQQEWAEVMSRHYDRHVEAVEGRRRTFLDPYGAEDPAEFLAVCTEAFFEQPRKLRERHPDLYRQLERYYALDPAAWFA